VSATPREALRRLVPAVLALAILVFGFGALDQYGVTWDEALGDFFFGQRYASFFATFDPAHLDFEADPYPPDHLPDLGSSPFRDRPWEYYPVANTLAAATSRITSGWLGWLDPFDGYHALNVLLAALFAFCFWRFLERRWGLVTATLAVGLLFTAPRVLFHTMANVKDFPLMIFFGLALLAFFTAWERGSAAGLVGAGVLWGLALGTKANAVFLPLVPLGVVLLARRPEPWRGRRRALGSSLLGAGFVGGAVAFAAWPYLWADPVARLLEHAHFLLGRHQTTRAESLTPAFEAVFLTTPPVFLALFALGLWPCLVRARRREGLAWLLLLWLADVPLRYLLPGAINYDGVRHFLELFPPMAAIAGLGAAWGLAHLGRFAAAGVARDGLKAVAVGLLLVPGVWACLASHPFQIAYWNALGGGPAGAYARGEPQAGDYWGSSYRQGLEWLNAHAEPEALLAVPVIEHAVRLVAPRRLRSDLVLLDVTTPYSPELRPGWADFLSRAARERPIYTMFVVRRDWMNPLMADCLRRLEPEAFWQLEGAPILAIYRWRPPGSAVDDPQHRQAPEPDVDDRGQVGEHRLGGIARIVRLINQVEIAEDTEEHQRQGVDQAVGAEAGDGVGVDGVERIGDHHRGGDDVDHLVEEGGAVALEHRALTDGLVFEEHQFVAPLGEDQKEREEDRAEEEPIRHHDPDRRRSRGHPQHVAARHRHHVEDHDPFEPGVVEQVDTQVKRQEAGEDEAQHEARSQRGGGQHEHRGGRGRHRNRPRGDRAMAFERVLSVFLAVAQVVEEIDRAGRETEGDERQAGTAESLGVSQALGEDDRRQDEGVLDPLDGAQRAEERFHHGAFIIETFGDLFVGKTTR